MFPARAARRLSELLSAELLGAASSAGEICVLLSGGLDSRIIAGTLTGLRDRGLLKARIRALTWGVAGCRDVVYARAVADILGIEDIHAHLEARHVLENIDRSIDRLGVPVSPLHLHRMLACSSLPPGTLVFATSYGGNLGRARHSGQHILDLPLMTLDPRFSLLTDGAWCQAGLHVASDMAALHNRTPSARRYALADIENLGIYMRNMLAHIMTIINDDGHRVYQAFTDPAVFSFLWSLHPSFRTSHIYAELLELTSPRLARIPWSHTNRALRGATVGADKTLKHDFHDYVGWVTGELAAPLREMIPMGWLSRSTVFDMRKVDALLSARQFFPSDFRAVQNIVWLATFGELLRRLDGRGISVVEDTAGVTRARSFVRRSSVAASVLGRAKSIARRTALARQVARRVREAMHLARLAAHLVTEPPDLTNR